MESISTIRLPYPASAVIMSDAGNVGHPTSVPARTGRDRETTPDLKSRSSDYDHRRSRSSRHDDEDDEERRRRRRQREEETPEERHERRKRRREQETEEERAERHRRRAERDARREAEDAGADEQGGDDPRPTRRRRSRSIESYRSHRSYRSREYEEERRRRDYDDQRGYYDDRRRNDAYYSPRRGSPPRRRHDDSYYSPRRASPPRRRRDSPMYDSPRRQRSSPPPPPPRSQREQSPVADGVPDAAAPEKKDEAEALLDSVDSEARSVFVSQLAAALTSRDLGMFFEDKLGKGSVRDARVVTDRVTKRSKGIAYVELASVPLVHRAIGLTGTIVMGLPIMITFTESERNNAHVNLDSLLAGSTVIRPATAVNGTPLPGVTAALPPPSVRDANPDAPIPYYRLYVGNLYYALTAEDLRQVFEPFGELSYVDLPMEPQTNRSRGYAFVQYKELGPAQMALQSMNGFELAGRSRESLVTGTLTFRLIVAFGFLAVKVATVHPKGAGAAVSATPAPAPVYMPQQESSYRVDLDDREGELP